MDWPCGTKEDGDTAAPDGKWRLPLNRELGRIELYDISTDWAEMTDLALEISREAERLTNDVLAWKTSLPSSPPASCFSNIRPKG